MALNLEFIEFYVIFIPHSNVRKRNEIKKRKFVKTNLKTLVDLANAFGSTQDWKVVNLIPCKIYYIQFLIP